MIVPVPVPQEALDIFASQIPPSLIHPGIAIEFACAQKGGRILDSHYEGVLADAFCLEAGMRAEDEGFAAVCINSMSDSGVAALRSRLSIPVIGTAQAAYAAATLLGKRFSIISMWDRWRWLYEKVIGEQGLSDRLASIRSIETRPDAAELLAGKEDSVFPLLAEAGRRAIEEDGADVLVLGSTTMHQSHRYLAETMPVPVINPGLVAFKTCEMLIELGLTHSKRCYQSPETTNDDIFDSVLARSAPCQPMEAR